MYSRSALQQLMECRPSAWRQARKKFKNLYWYAQVLEVLLEQRDLSEQEVCTAVEVRPDGASAPSALAALLRTLTKPLLELALRA